MSSRRGARHLGLAKFSLGSLFGFALLVVNQPLQQTPLEVAAVTHAIHARASAVSMTLPANVAPDPSFLDNCPATTQSDFCLGEEIEAIDNARAEEGLGPIHIRLAGFNRLSPAEQLFALTDIERTSRHLPPAVAMTSQLNAVAAQGAAQAIDPALGGWTLRGGKQAVAWGSNWSGGLSTMAANYYWMYSDGTGFNIDCTRAGAPGCWAHRENILAGTTGSCGSPGVTPQFVMGAAVADGSKYTPSDAEILVQECGGTPTDAVFTWARTERVLGVSI